MRGTAGQRPRNYRALAYDPEGNVAQDRQYDVRFTYQGMNRLASCTQNGTSYTSSTIPKSRSSRSSMSTVVCTGAARYPDGKVELRMPDAVGNLFRTSMRTDREYGPAGQLLASRSAAGETRYRYDPEGNLIEKSEPTGRVWR